MVVTKLKTSPTAGPRSDNSSRSRSRKGKKKRGVEQPKEVLIDSYIS